MDKKLYELARLIKLMGKDVAKESAWWKVECISAAIGLNETEKFFDEISVTDDSGYRSITIGDTRGNVSRVNGRRISEEEHKGYMFLYSENREGKYHYACFPPINEIYRRLCKVVQKEILAAPDTMYARKDAEALEYYAKVVTEHAEVLSKIGKTAQEILDSYC